MSKLLINENPLQVLPSLAVKTSLNEAIVLQQIHYWLEKSEHIHDGRKWVYNSIDNWCEQFPFFSKSTVDRTFKSLCDRGLLIKGNYNKSKFDKTNWYSIDYDRLGQLENDDDFMVNEPITSNWSNGEIQNEVDNTIDYNTENTNIDYSTKNNNAFSEDKSSSKVDMYASAPEKQEVDEPQKENRYISQDYTYEQLREHIKPVYKKSLKEKYGYTDKDTPIESMLDITVEFYKLYERKTRHKHKVLSDSSYDRIADFFMNPPNKLSEDECALDLETHLLMAEQYFITNYNKRGKFNGSVEKSFSHFMSGLIRDNLYWQTCV